MFQSWLQLVLDGMHCVSCFVANNVQEIALKLSCSLELRVKNQLPITFHQPLNIVQALRIFSKQAVMWRELHLVQNATQLWALLYTIMKIQFP
jgi:hypothetical protein